MRVLLVRKTSSIRLTKQPTEIRSPLKLAATGITRQQRAGFQQSFIGTMPRHVCLSFQKLHRSCSARRTSCPRNQSRLTEFSKRTSAVIDAATWYNGGAFEEVLYRV